MSVFDGSVSSTSFFAVSMPRDRELRLVEQPDLRDLNILPPLGFGPTVAFSAKIFAAAGQVYTVELDYHRVQGFFGSTFVKPGGGVGGLLGVQLSWASLQPPPNFAKYDAVVVCVGTNNQYDGEGYDRPFQLPEFQDELIQNVSRVNPRTIVVTHGGGSFDVQPWINQVRGLLQAWYPGQNGGQAWQKFYSAR